MENTSDSFMPGPLLFCMKIERSVCYKVTDNSAAGMDGVQKEALDKFGQALTEFLQSTLDHAQEKQNADPEQ